MSAALIDGKLVAAAIREEVAAGVRELSDLGIIPGLATVLIGDDPGSHSYVGMKKKACGELGIQSFAEEHSSDMSEEELLALVERLNGDPAVHGILVQLPLPGHIDEQKVLLAITVLVIIRSISFCPQDLYMTYLQ